MAPLTRSLALAGLLLPATAFADEEAAEACVQAKVRDSYADGWSVRTTSSATLAQGEREIYVLTLHSGNAYRVVGCADAELSNLDLVIYDAEGKLVASDGTQDREPVVELTPTTTGKYYVAVFASATNSPDVKAGIATAVTYR